LTRKLASNGWVCPGVYLNAGDQGPRTSAPGLVALASFFVIERARLHYQQPFDWIVLVGDSDCDVSTAARLGLGFLGIAADANDRVLREAGAQFMLRDYENFATFMRTTENARPRA